MAEKSGQTMRQDSTLAASAVRPGSVPYLASLAEGALSERAPPNLSLEPV